MPLLNVHAYWTAWRVPPTMVTLSPDDSLVVKWSAIRVNSCLSQEQVGYSTKFINHLRCQNLCTKCHRCGYLDTKKITQLAWRWLCLVIHYVVWFPATGREEYMCIKLHKDIHHLWTERKQVLQLKSNSEVSIHLNLPSASSSAIWDRSEESKTMLVARSTQLLSDQSILEVREDS